MKLGHCWLLEVFRHSIFAVDPMQFHAINDRRLLQIFKRRLPWILAKGAVLDLDDPAIVVVADFGAFALHFDKLNVGPGDFGLVAKELLKIIDARVYTLGTNFRLPHEGIAVNAVAVR